MGNSISTGGSATRTAGPLDSFVAELNPELVYEKGLGTTRFLKTAKVRHRNGPLVVKVFIKPDPAVSLRLYSKQLNNERLSLADIPNVYSYQAFHETDKAGYMLRQWLASSLYDRISTRPFLSTIEKKWVVFQLLSGMRDARNRKIAHGDIKSENVLITSWNWAYLTDFASYKPTYLPLDDPADFSFFFDSSGRRTCYLAPERFYESGSDISKRKAEMQNIIEETGLGKKDGKVTEAMDVFGLGCVVAELFLDGAPLFTLSQLFKYRAGEMSVDTQLAAIEDQGIRSLILQMIALDPAKRPTFDALLQECRGTTLPEAFYSFLHNYVSTLNEPSSSAPHPFSASSAPSASDRQASGSGPKALPTDADHRIERIWTDFESMEPYLLPDSNIEETVMEVKNDYSASTSQRPFQDVFPVELNIPDRQSSIQGPLASGQRAAAQDGAALVILALICANLRNCARPSSKLRALDTLLALSSHLTDEAKLDRLVPYVIDLLHDDAAIVRAAALRTVVQVLMLISTITPSNSAIFPEYIIPNIWHISKDPDASVRVMYAQCIDSIAQIAQRVLEMGQAIKAHGKFKLTEAQDLDDTKYEVSYDAALQDLQAAIQDQLVTLLVDPSSAVKRAVLHNVSFLCIFFGKPKTNDVLLSHMITYLNDRDWLLRYAFFESIVDVAACVGAKSLEDYILPLMIQALSDVEESVVAKVLESLTSLCELGLFHKMRMWELMSASVGFLYHPNVWIREGAAAFIASAAKHLPETDVWCILYPSLKHVLKCDIREINDANLLINVKSPLPRRIFDAALAWAMRSDKSQFWAGSAAKGKPASKMDIARDGLSGNRKVASFSNRTSTQRTDDDDAQISRLQQLGMNQFEEAKLLALRDYVVKLAHATASFASRGKPESESADLAHANIVLLQKLNIVPQTLFLRPRPADRISSRLDLPRAMSDHGRRTPMSRMSRAGSIDQPAGQVLDDLRRRLTQQQASSSMTINTARARQDSTLSPMTPDLQSPRPPSPTDSVTSATHDPAHLMRNYRHMTLDRKAAPAIGSIRTNATGVLENSRTLRSLDEESVSGRASPASAAGTIRPEFHGRVTSMQPLYEEDGGQLGHMLEHVYANQTQDAMLDFGPRIHEGPPRRRNVIRTSLPPREPSGRRSEATLVTHLSAHAGPINSIVVSPDHLFFISCSDDKSVKIWDTSRLERNVTSKPRTAYLQHNSKVACLCIIEGTHCFASAGADGSIHIVRVHLTQGSSVPKYSKLTLVREYHVDNTGEYATALAHFNAESTSNLLYATNMSNIVMLDIRTMRTILTMENPRHHGPISALCLGRQRAWLVVGTLTGVLTLWDLRFGLLLRTWHVGSSLNRGVPVCVNRITLHPSKGNGLWIIVALGAGAGPHVGPASELRPLMEVWDVEKGTLVETFATRDLSLSETGAPPSAPSPLPSTSQDVNASPAAGIAALVRARTGSSQSPAGSSSSSNPFRSRWQPQLSEDSSSSPAVCKDVAALAAGVDFGGQSFPSGRARAPGADAKNSSRGYVITGSEDKRLRFWDIGRIERSTVISAPLTDDDRPITLRVGSDGLPTHLETATPPSTTSSGNRARKTSTAINTHQQTLLKAHQDCITAVACLDSPFRGGIVTGDRSGVLKVFKLDTD
ncbi:ARM repeat-containing protein [Exidia glandulosa HHB12029]|uniref:non-specific serine/threonine protein kinase n=1 Tax=Exidia glandulosa HHB12029 TaxID=1314781 RepID=A0A165EVM6_EXIGL|nr:ARM repeat-containing protein [Exidia glandulosa HHB12029]